MGGGGGEGRVVAGGRASTESRRHGRPFGRDVPGWQGGNGNDHMRLECYHLIVLGGRRRRYQFRWGP